MSKVLSPQTEAELAEVIAGGTAFHITGLDSKQGLGRIADGMEHLSMMSFSSVTLYEPEELVLEAGAATPLRDIQALLAARQQMLAFEPPNYAHLWGAKTAGSLGGLLATGLSGPRRIRAGSARDHILGVTGVTGRAEIFKAGARVVKNVTGYDMPKLMAGSYGTLAALTSVTFKVLPAPETEETVFIAKSGDAAAMQLMSQALQSSAEISAAAHLPGVGTYLRVEGIAVSVKARRESLMKRSNQSCDVLDEKASREIWSRIRDCKVIAADRTRALWRISLPPMDGAKIAATIAAKTDIKYFFDWGGGLLWASLPAENDGGEAVVRSSITQGTVTNGHATLFAGPEELRAKISVFQPQTPTVAALTARVKSALDPLAKLNPGRMYKGV
jgi:glycolate oxidase FAD binding subunit